MEIGGRLKEGALEEDRFICFYLLVIFMKKKGFIIFLKMLRWLFLIFAILLFLWVIKKLILS